MYTSPHLQISIIKDPHLKFEMWSSNDDYVKTERCINKYGPLCRY